MKTPVDTIIYNANIYTVNEDFEKATAFAIQDGKFLAVGEDPEILALYSSNEMVNAQSKTIFPGFIDAHCHFYGLGMTLQQVNLVETKSYDEVLERIQKFYLENRPSFITGRGWNQNDWKEQNFPTKEKLDKLFPDIPVAVNRIDGHAMLVNQKALDLAAINIGTKIDGGKLLEEDGKLTGVLLDNAMKLIFKVIPKPSKKLQINGLKGAEKICFSYGLTTVDDAELGRNTVELIQELHESQELKIRIYAMILATDESLDYFINKGITKTDRLHIRAFKLYVDGALGSKSSLMKENYPNTENKGILMHSKERILEVAQRIKNSDFQMNVHAIGDKANEIILKTFVEELDISKERRWRVEHAQIVDKEDFKYFEKILPSTQPTHATSDMYWAEKLIGKEKIKGAYANKELLKRHQKIALGTDFPIEQVNPFLTFYSAVARKDIHGFPENGFYPEQSLNREETIKGMTIWAAYSNFEEKEKGSIEVGKLADFIFLNKDIMTIDIEEVPNCFVEKTYLGGALVFSKGN